MCKIKTLDKNVVLPSEIELHEIEEDSHDIWCEDNLFDFDETQARQERRHIDRIIKDLKSTGHWIER